MVAVVVIGVEIAGVDRGQGVAAGDDVGDGPAMAETAARIGSGAVVDDAVFPLGSHPIGVEVDIGVAQHGMVAEKIKSEESGHGTLGAGGDIEEDIHTGTVGGKVDADLAPAGAAC